MSQLLSDSCPSPFSDIPQDASSLIIIDDQGPSSRFLMGLRNKNLSFMPNKYVFPGGKVETDDLNLTTIDDLSKRDKLLLSMKTSTAICEQMIRGLALAAIRETYEETGNIVGKPNINEHIPQNSSWNAFYSQNVIPSLSFVKFCGRAITPENNVRRYDTRFFCTHAKYIAKSTLFRAGEFDHIKWLTFQQTLQYPLPNITRNILQKVYEGLYQGDLFSDKFQVPFYYTQNNNFKNELLS